MYSKDLALSTHTDYLCNVYTYGAMVARRMGSGRASGQQAVS